MQARSRTILSLKQLCQLEWGQGKVTKWDEHQKTTSESGVRSTFNCLQRLNTVVALDTGAKSRATVPSIHAFDAVGTLVAPTDFNRPYARTFPNATASLRSLTAESGRAIPRFNVRSWRGLCARLKEPSILSSTFWKF